MCSLFAWMSCERHSVANVDIGTLGRGRLCGLRATITVLAMTPWIKVGNGGMGYWDYYRGP